MSDLDRLLDPLTEILAPESATAFLALRPDPDVEARVAELRRKANDGWKLAKFAFIPSIEWSALPRHTCFREDSGGLELPELAISRINAGSYPVCPSPSGQ